MQPRRPTTRKKSVESVRELVMDKICSEVLSYRQPILFVQNLVDNSQSASRSKLATQGQELQSLKGRPTRGHKRARTATTFSASIARVFNPSLAFQNEVIRNQISRKNSASASGIANASSSSSSVRPPSSAHPQASETALRQCNVEVQTSTAITLPFPRTQPRISGLLLSRRVSNPRIHSNSAFMGQGETVSRKPQEPSWAAHDLSTGRNQPPIQVSISRRQSGLSVEGVGKVVNIVLDPLARITRTPSRMRPDSRLVKGRTGISLKNLATGLCRSSRNRGPTRTGTGTAQEQEQEQKQLQATFKMEAVPVANYHELAHNDYSTCPRTANGQTQFIIHELFKKRHRPLLQQHPGFQE